MYFKAHSRKASAKKSLTGFCFRKYGHQEELGAVVLSLRREVWKVYKGLSGFSFLSVFCQHLSLVQKDRSCLLRSSTQAVGTKMSHQLIAAACWGSKHEHGEALEHSPGSWHSSSSSAIPSPASPTSPLRKLLTSQGGFKHLGRFWRKKISGARRANQTIAK